MISELSVRAVEGSTYIVTLEFTDEDGNPVVPNTVTWTLTYNGAVINSRQDVSETPASTIEVALYGNDLPVGTGLTVQNIIFTVSATYDSVAHGSDLPLKGQCEIPVDKLES